MPHSCEQIKQEYKDLQTLKSEFDLAYKEAVKTGDLVKAKELKARLEKGRDALWEKLWPFEALSQEKLKEQYETQKEILQRNGILEQLSSGELGIKAIDNQEYAFPSFPEITQGLRKNKEMFKTKIEQGFNQLLITPFGMKLDDLTEKYKQVILKHHKEGKLFATKENPGDPDEKLELDEANPVWVWDEYKEADQNGKLVYSPQEFSANHQGKTKQEILNQTKQGFSVKLMEDLPNLPRANKGKEIKGRKQLEAGQSPNKYLETFKTDPIHKNETGLTPEEWLTYALQYLEQFNQVIDDYSGKGSASFQVGAYFTSGAVPYSSWFRVYQQALLGGHVPGYSFSAYSIRAAVRV
jgi:hypothetical protein